MDRTKKEITDILINNTIEVNTPIITVIVPVYKVEQYLPKCIDSILAQTFTDFELLLIDDGSPDYSGKICDQYAEKDGRIRVFHKSNGGVSSARNMGLDNARGEWIAFVDSDDWIGIDFLNPISMANDDVFMLQSGYNVQKKNEVFVSCTPKCKKKLSVCEFIVNGMMSLTIWSYFIRRSLIDDNSIRFNMNLTHGEDYEFLVKCLLMSNSIECVGLCEYYYRYNVESATNRILVYSECKNPLLIIDEVYLYVVENNINAEYNRIILKVIFQTMLKKYISNIANNGLGDIALSSAYMDFDKRYNKLIYFRFDFIYRVMFDLFKRNALFVMNLYRFRMWLMGNLK